MAVTPEIEADVLRIFRNNPKRFSPFKAANQVGASLGEVLSIVRAYKDVPVERVEHNDGAGREDLQAYIVAARRASDLGWNNDDTGVVEARRRFCAGTHDMATHRDGPWLLLCSFPLQRKRTPRPNYFLMGAA